MTPGTKIGSSLATSGAMGGVISASPFIQQLNENAPAYGIIVSGFIGILGAFVMALNGYLQRKEQRRFNNKTLEQNDNK